MEQTLTFNIVSRSDTGKGASRRLRRQGLVPGIIYGGNEAPEMIATAHNELLLYLEHEAFYSSILTINKENGDSEQVVLKDLQRHPAKPFVLHFDLMRVAPTDQIKMHVPLHFIGEDTAPGVKAGGLLHHALVDVEISCEAQHLPEHIEVDVSGMKKGDILHLSDLKLPEGVKIVALSHGDGHDNDEPVVSIQ